MKAWTIGGQRNLGMEAILGTLEKGKRADIAVFNKNLLSLDPKEAKTAQVVLTVMDGKTVYKRG